MWNNKLKNKVVKKGNVQSHICLLPKIRKQRKRERFIWGSWAVAVKTDCGAFTTSFLFFLIWVKLGHEIVEGATVVSGAISPDQSSSVDKDRERCKWMGLYSRRQSCLRPERAWRVRAEEDGVTLTVAEKIWVVTKGWLLKMKTFCWRREGALNIHFPSPVWVCFHTQHTKWHKEHL